MMMEHEIAKSPMTDGLTISPSLDLVVESAQVPSEVPTLGRRTLQISCIAVFLGTVAAFVAQALIALIDLTTNIAFFQNISLASNSPADAVPELGWTVVLIPIAGAIIIGFMARYGSQAIRGHGIPEAMEQVLTNESRIPARVTFLKPLSSAISIGTGGPFGAEGPIIATGAALGSLLGQSLHTSSAERKTLLAAGAAAGMAATFGSPVSAVLLAIELLLFEFRPQSIIPVAFAATAATGMRMFFEGADPIFSMPNLQQPSGTAIVAYVLLGGTMGVVSVGVTKAVYWIEDCFDRLPIHWMWWPALGAVVVGVIGYFEPNTLGVGYNNIRAILSDRMTVSALAFLCSMKFVSWSIALGSGTSGGTLAPLFTIGGGTGAIIGAGVSWAFPAIGIDVRIAALVGMAAIFAGASRAMLASAVFAFETTMQVFGLLPLLGGCAAAFLTSSLLMKNSIMTEKISRRGVKTPGEYEADLLDQIAVREIMSEGPITITATDTLAAVRRWLKSLPSGKTHQGFPVVNGEGRLVGVLTQRELWGESLDESSSVGDQVFCSPRFIYDDCTVRQAIDHMVNHSIGRLPVVCRVSSQLVGIVTRSDVLSVYRRRVAAGQLQEPTLRWPVRHRGLKK